MAEPTQAERNAALASRMGDKLGVGRGSLQRVKGRAGRWLPRWLRRDADYLIEAEALAKHPKLRHMVDPARAAKAEKRLLAHLATRDPAKERTDRLLGQLAAFAFNMLLLAALVIAVLWWRGLIGPGR